MYSGEYSSYFFWPAALYLAASPLSRHESNVGQAPSPHHYSWRFVAKSCSRVARRARGAQRTGSVICDGTCHVVLQTGTGAKKKGASPQQ